MKSGNKWKVGFYGDDFTGSTDVMEVLSIYGIPTILFLAPPDPFGMDQYAEKYEAVGIAGISRSLATEKMDAELLPAFHALDALEPELIHYKICSTFDSSPEIGSIGHAIDVGAEVFDASCIPLVVGAPRLNRFVAFGNLFARVGELTYRLDRHPTMSRHPITPMKESDIRMHLSKQTDRSSGLVSILELESEEKRLREHYESQCSSHGVVLFDTTNAAHLQRVGKLLWKGRKRQRQFVVGSSGIEYAIGQYLVKIGKKSVREEFKSAGAQDSVFIICGSASPATAGQIQYALEKGFVGHQLSFEQLLHPTEGKDHLENLVLELSQQIDAGFSVVAYATLGPDDPRIAERAGLESKYQIQSLGSAIAAVQAKLLKKILERNPKLRRICVAGGDTSGYCAKALGIRALEMAATIAPGAPLCRAIADGKYNGLEVAFKGGQNGSTNYFECIRAGQAL